ncbi:hypothetical protein ACR6C2_02045 [Streptomyces sp. INA 01156]
MGGATVPVTASRLGMMEMDPPDSLAYRRLIAPFFSARTVREYTPADLDRRPAPRPHRRVGPDGRRRGPGGGAAAAGHRRSAGPSPRPPAALRARPAPGRRPPEGLGAGDHRRDAGDAGAGHRVAERGPALRVCAPPSWRPRSTGGPSTTT